MQNINIRILICGLILMNVILMILLLNRTPTVVVQPVHIVDLGKEFKSPEVTTPMVPAPPVTPPVITPTPTPEPVKPEPPKEPVLSEADIERRAFGMTAAEYKSSKGVDPVDDRKFSRKWTSTTPTADIRKAKYDISEEPMPILRHKGGSVLDKEELYDTIRAVIKRMPNIKYNENLVDFVYRTLIVESGAGSARYTYAATHYKNYGMAQFRSDTAEGTLKWLKSQRPDAYDAVMRLYDSKESMVGNLMENVPFSIAMLLQYYWYRVPSFQEHIPDMLSQGALYKSEYNTHKGAATINTWLKRVAEYQ